MFIGGIIVPGNSEQTLEEIRQLALRLSEPGNGSSANRDRLIELVRKFGKQFHIESVAKEATD